MTKSLPEQSAVALTPQKTTLARKAFTQAEITFSSSARVFKQSYKKLTFKCGRSTLSNTRSHNHGQGAEQRVTPALPRAAPAWPRRHGLISITAAWSVQDVRGTEPRNRSLLSLASCTSHGADGTHPSSGTLSVIGPFSCRRACLIHAFAHASTFGPFSA